MPHYIKEWPQQVSTSFCQHLIERFEADKRIQADPQPDYSSRTFLLISKQKDWSDEVKRLDNVVNECVKRYFKVPKNMRSIAPAQWGHDGYLMARYMPGDTCVLHVDGQCAVPPQNELRLATFLLFLNNVGKGGETSFPMQNVKIAPEPGKVVMFPVGHTHPHEVFAPSTPRYILQTWIVDPTLVISRKARRK